MVIRAPGRMDMIQVTDHPGIHQLHGAATADCTSISDGILLLSQLVQHSVMLMQDELTQISIALIAG